jgi:hypothetical protein
MMHLNDEGVKAAKGFKNEIDDGGNVIDGQCAQSPLIFGALKSHISIDIHG